MSLQIMMIIKELPYATLTKPLSEHSRVSPDSTCAMSMSSSFRIVRPGSVNTSPHPAKAVPVATPTVEVTVPTLR